MDRLKWVFYRFCFFLGLATATYCSYAQVTSWMNPAPKSEVSSVHPAAAFAPAWTSSQPFPPIPVEQHPTHEKSVPSTPVLTSQALAVAPSPSATPEVSPTPEATAQGEGASPEGFGPIATVEPLPAFMNPEAWMAFQQQGLRAPAQEPSARTEAPVSSGSASAQGMLLPSADALAGNAGASSNGPSGGGAGVSGFGFSPSGQTGLLGAQDFAALQSPLQGLLPDQTVTVSGLFCGNGLHGRGCNAERRMMVHTSRFSLNEGLHEQALVSFSGSNAGNLEFSVSLRIQDASGKDSTLSGTVRVSEVRVRQETREGRQIRVLEMKAPDIEIRQGDRLRKVMIRVVLDGAPGEDLTVLPESSISFVRKSVTTSPLTWNFAAPAPVASGDPALIADEIPYSMSIEKSR
jgi:hypothetical protein